MRRRLLAAGVLAAAVALGAALLVGGSDYDGPSVAFDGRSPRAPVGERVRVLVELQRPSLGERVEREGTLEASVQHAHVRDLERESRALKSALNAKGVRLRDLVVFSRVWSGFAATVETADLPQVQTQGVRVEPVRRFYPASARSLRLPGMLGALAAQPGPQGGAEPALALLDSAVDVEHERLRERVEPGYDAVARDGDPFISPGARGRRDEHGTQTAGVLLDELGKSERVVSVRVAGVQGDPETGSSGEFGTTDQLISGLEYAVDPDRDGDTSDGLPVALAALNSPYAGFAGTPEDEAAEAARTLGTLVIAPAGNEGEPGGRFGTVGSPAAADDVLAVAALEGAGPAVPEVELGLASDEGRATLDAALLAGGGEAVQARMSALHGPSQADPRADGRAAGGSFLEYFDAAARPRARGRAIVVPLRSGSGREPSIAARASAAAAAGAAALIVCDPDGEQPAAPVPRGAGGGGLPVLGLAGGDAERALEIAGSDGHAFISGPDSRDAGGDLRAAAGSSRGPTYALAMKPELAAPGSATSAAAGGGEAFVSGTSVAAARAAAAALELHRARPDAPPEELAAALVGSARPLGHAAATGAGELDADGARGASVLASPATVTFPRQPSSAGWNLTREIELRNTGREALDVELETSTEAGGLEVEVPERVRIEPGAAAPVVLTLRARQDLSGFVSGRLEGRWDGGSVTVPFGVFTGDAPPPRLGELELVRQGERTRGVSFSAGAVTEPGGALAVEPLGELILVLVPADGGSGRELTPPGGAVDLLPGEYAYTLTDQILDELTPGSYRFEARARGPAGGPPAERRSETFEVP